MSELMQKQLDKRNVIRTALGPFFPGTINPAEGRIFVFTGTRQVVF